MVDTPFLDCSVLCTNNLFFTDLKVSNFTVKENSMCDLLSEVKSLQGKSIFLVNTL